MPFPVACIAAATQRRKGQNAASSIAFQTACTVGDTFDPQVTLVAGCPYTPHWDFGNGDTFDGINVSYAGFADAGPHTVTLTIPDIGTWLATIDVYNDKITGDFLGALAPCLALTAITTGENTNLASDLSSLAGLTNLQNLDLREHQTLLTGDIAVLAGLPALTRIYCAGCGIHGDLADIAGMTQLTYLDLHQNNSNGGVDGELADLAALTGLTFLSVGGLTGLTGDLADIATLVDLTTLNIYIGAAITGNVSALAPLTKLTFLRIDSGSSGLTPDSFPFPKLQYLYMYNNGYSQAVVDGVLAQIYADRASYSSTTARITLLIGLNNAAPSGAYADEDPPTTGLGYVFELATDPESEGFKPWTITYNGGAGANVTRP